MQTHNHVILVDENDQPVGSAEKLAAHEQNLLHRAFSIFIFNKNKPLELLLQQRAFSKYHSPGLWTNTCCSHPRPDETVLAAAERRLQEEFGFTTPLQQLGRFHYNAHFPNGLSENEIDHVLIGYIDKADLIRPQPAEIHAYRWITPDALKAEMHANPAQFTPWLAQALDIALGKLA
jgi:isopentenyl-diphosphate delta-isomerase type 1